MGIDISVLPRVRIGLHEMGRGFKKPAQVADKTAACLFYYWDFGGEGLRTG